MARPDEPLLERFQEILILNREASWEEVATLLGMGPVDLRRHVDRWRRQGITIDEARFGGPGNARESRAAAEIPGLVPATVVILAGFLAFDCAGLGSPSGLLNIAGILVHAAFFPPLLAIARDIKRRGAGDGLVVTFGKVSAYHVSLYLAARLATFLVLDNLLTSVFVAAIGIPLLLGWLSRLWRGWAPVARARGRGSRWATRIGKRKRD